MKLPLKIIAENENQTKDLAKEFSKVLNQGDVISLIGDLGAGKTFFVKSVLAEFGELNVSSPTFAIVNVYEKNIRINHFDFYRIKKIDELYDIGFSEYINDEESIIFIEWADMFEEILPNRRYEVTIKSIDISKREFTIKKLG